MQDQQVTTFKIKEQPPSLRTQQLINYLEDLWKRPHEPSSDMLKRITGLLSQLPEPYQALAMTKIAQYFVSRMGLHFLDLMAIFKREAVNEGTDVEECIQVLNGIIPELFSEMMGMSKHIHLRSLDDLVTLTNITFGLYTLSHVDTAEEAQGWMYELPVVYWRQLSQEHLISYDKAVTLYC